MNISTEFLLSLQTKMLTNLQVQGEVSSSDVYGTFGSKEPTDTGIEVHMHSAFSHSADTVRTVYVIRTFSPYSDFLHHTDRHMICTNTT